MNKYFRITGYNPQEDYCFIMDVYGKFEKLWQFSSCLLQKGIQVLEVGDSDKFIDINFDKVNESSDKFILRATGKGKPTYKTVSLNGTEQKAITVGDKSYVPQKA